MPYPPRPQLQVLPQFVGTSGVRQTPEQRAQLLTFVKLEYVENGRSLRELAELTGRSQTAIRRALGQAEVSLRASGAPVLAGDRPQQPSASDQR